jgi:hypothetical protein
MTATITAVNPVDETYQVVTIEGGRQCYRREPCGGCPWRVDQTGIFPAKAFRHAANTAHDMSDRQFACHESGSTKPATCAGFLLRGADHNLSVRMKRMRGEIRDDVHDGGHELHADYRAMAIANGVDPTDQAISACR